MRMTFDAARRARVRRATRSTSRSPPRSRCSSWPAATSRPGRRSAPGRRCAPCSSWARRTSRCCADGRRAARSGRPSSPSAIGSSSGPGRRSPPTAWSSTGSSAVDASLLTGEPVPVEVGPGDAVIGATVNAGGRLVVRATRVGADTQLAQIARLVEQAQTGKAPVQRLADRVSAVFVPVVIALAVGTLALLAGRRRRRGGGVHRRRRGADHRLPVRARPGDPDRAAGRHRARRAARHPDQGPAGARVHPPGRHRSCWTRPAPSPPARMTAGRRRRRPTASPRTRAAARWPARSRTPPSTRSARRSRPAPATALGALPAGRASSPPRASGVHGVVDGRARGRRPRLPGSRSEWAQRARPPSSSGPAAPPRPPARPSSRSAGTARSGPAASSPTR